MLSAVTLGEVALLALLKRVQCMSHEHQHKLRAALQASNLQTSSHQAVPCTVTCNSTMPDGLCD